MGATTVVLMASFLVVASLLIGLWVLDAMRRR